MSVKRSFVTTKTGKSLAGKDGSRSLYISLEQLQGLCEGCDRAATAHGYGVIVVFWKQREKGYKEFIADGVYFLLQR